MGAHVRCALIALCLAACGDDSSSSADAGDGDALAIDAPMQVPCTYTEAQDATNNTAAGAEVTNVMFAAQTTALCGVINTGHFDATNEVVDVDRFTFTTTGDYDVLVHFIGASAVVFDDVVMQIDGASTTRLGYGTFQADHATLAARLPAGQYTIILGAFDATASSADINYRIELRNDMPATRCPKVTANASYTEANDTNGIGNDMIRYDTAASPQSSLTTANDSPEATNLTLASGTAYRITGQSADVDQNGDSYKDRDTYVFATDATTNQLSIRLNWPGTTADFDYRIYRPSSTSSFAGGLDSAPMEEEFETFAVRPNTMYWLWIAAYDTATGLPITYDASLCAETFSP